MNSRRLFQIYLRLLPGEQVTAAELARDTGVSERTVYRDVQRLVEAGLQVHGAAGVGYRLREPPALPPLLLTEDEMRALVARAYAVQSSSDASMASGARSLLEKLRATVPPRSRGKYGLKG